MTAWAFALLALLALAARALWLRHELADWQPLWRLAAGPITVELRRQARLSRLGGDSQAFPLPREYRVLSLRLAGIPLWSQQAIIGLPLGVDARIGQLAADEFDLLFAPSFRLRRASHSLRGLFVRPGAAN